MDRQRQARWDKLHMRTLCTRVTLKRWRQFRAACAHRRSNPNRVLGLFVAIYIRQWQQEIAARDSKGGGGAP